MTVLGASDWAYVAVGLAVPVFGFLAVWVQMRKTHNEVKSPNGMPTGSIAYEAWKHVIEMRESQVEGWERARRDTEVATKERARIEGKVDKVAAEQLRHHHLDDIRFGALFKATGILDPAKREGRPDGPGD